MSKKTSEKILHVDGDGFFASVERAQYPHLRDKPVVVGTERSIVTAATYEAKALGVKRGMPIFQVKKRFPSVVVLPTHFELYEMYRDKLSAILSKFSPTVERYSIDECFAILREKDSIKYGGLESFLDIIKTEVQKRIGITYSFGLADTKVLAKVASKSNKPNGKTFIKECDRKKYLAEAKIDSIWGIGFRTAFKLNMKGIKTALDFSEKDKSFIDGFAEPFKDIWHELNGERVFEVHMGGKHQSKSLQTTRSFPSSSDKVMIFSELSKNVETVCSHLRSEGQVAKKAWIFLKQADFKRKGCEIELSYPTNNPVAIMRSIRSVFDELFKHKVFYRTTGITLYELFPEKFMQADLFGERQKLYGVDEYIKSVDDIRSKFGENVICLASSLRSNYRRSESYANDHKNESYISGLPFPYLGEVC